MDDILATFRPNLFAGKRVLISGGTVTGVDYGVWVNTYEGYESNASNTQVTISGGTITASQIGVYVEDSPENGTATATATLENDPVISTGGSGIGMWVTRRLEASDHTRTSRPTVASRRSRGCSARQKMLPPPTRVRTLVSFTSQTMKPCSQAAARSDPPPLNRSWRTSPSEDRTARAGSPFAETHTTSP